MRLRPPRLVARRPMTRPPIERVQWIDERLHADRSLTAADVARRFEVSARTVYRDLEFMRDRMHAPIVFDAERSTYLLTDKTYRLPLAEFSAGEVVALLFAERVSRQYRGTPYEDDVRSAFARIAERLPGEIDVDSGRLDEMLALDLGPVPIPDPVIFRTIVQALLARRRLLVRYHSLTSNKRRERRIEPYKVFNLRGTWYLAAFDHPRQEVRDFALHRVEAATPLDETYAIDPKWTFTAYARDSFGIEKGGAPVRVAIRFAPRQARWIRECHWHATARVQEQMDGSCVLHLCVSGLDEVRRWVMQFGAEAEVLKPAKLRKEVARELERASHAYQGDREAARSAGAMRRRLG